MNEQTDLATDFDRNLNSIIDRGAIKSGDVKIVWRSEPLPNEPIVVRADLDPALTQKVQEIVLAITEEQALTLMPKNYTGWRLADAPLWRVMTRSFADADLHRAAAALTAVGLADRLHQRADTLSGGQQQRVAIARAIAQESRVLLADEPVASLDPETAVAILALLRDLTRTAGIGVLCTLHQPQLAEKFADRVLTMDSGRLCRSA